MTSAGTPPLADLIASVADLPDTHGWVERTSGYDAVVERDLESRFAISNGLIGTRASLDLPIMASHPRMYVAGLFDALPDSPGGPSLVPAPDWCRFTLSIDGRGLDAADCLERVLDLSTGTLAGTYRWQGGAGDDVSLATWRFVSLHDRSFGVQLARLAAPEGAEIALEALLVPTSLALLLERIEGPVSVWRTAFARRRIVLRMDAALYVGDRLLPFDDPGASLSRRWKWRAGGEPASLVRTLRVAAEGDPPERSWPSSSLSPELLRQAADANRAAWRRHWRNSQVEIDSDAAAQRAIRFATYHLISSANPDDERVSVAARGLTGDAYAGHVFWDTEAFLLPFYTLTWPQAARAMLMYRYHTLPAARAKAERLGYKGALYAWESADTGDETTPEVAHLPNGEVVPILCGRIEHHISADVAFAVWQYWLATHDEQFLREAAAEILVEVARFWASRTVEASDGVLHIRGVIGPDEYHEEVDDNAFTNVMAQWSLETACEAARLLEGAAPHAWAKLARRLTLAPAELDAWRDAAGRLYTGLNQESGLYEQFAGYFDLEEIDLSAFEPRTVPMDVLLGRARTKASQVIKQADVVMLLAMLWDRFPPEVRRPNFEHYERRCGHGSSLSPGIHGLVAARLGKLDLARKYLDEAASIDLGDESGNMAGGVHMATLGSIWQLVVFGFAGLSLGADALRVEPQLPAGWRSLSIPVGWRGSRLRILIDRESAAVTASVLDGAPATVEVHGRRRVVAKGNDARWALSHGRERQG